MTSLPYAHLQFMPLKELHPDGWLLDFLNRQASGLTGNVGVSGYPYGYKFWGSREGDQRGAYEAWWPYEQTAYWIDGALKCGYLSGNRDLYNAALDEIDFAIDHAAPDGFIGPASMREKDRWPHAVFFRAVLAQYEISADPRYLQALIRHYRSTPHPMAWDRDVTGVEILLKIFQETGQADFLDMAKSLYARFNDGFPDHDCSLQTLLSEKRPTEHGVTFNEEAKLAAMLFSATGEEQYLRAVIHGYEKVDRYALLPDGLHSCSEHIRGNTASDLHETCDITDHTWALGYLLEATGDARYADRVEQVIFNALPGSISKDFHALQYFSCPNQVIATSTSNHNPFMHGLNWMSYRPDHEVQCCPGNVHRAMPNFISRMWMRSAEDALVAVLYGPGTLSTTIGSEGVPVTIQEQTRYPYEQSIQFRVTPARAVRFSLAVRIPAWCSQARLVINQVPETAQLKPGSFFTITRTWQPGDTLQLDLPFALGMDTWPGGGVSLTYGPLTLAMPVPTRAEIEIENSTTLQRMNTLADGYAPRPALVKDDFPAWNLFPAGPWNYALCIQPESLNQLKVEWNQSASDPFDPANPILRVQVPARRVHGWRVVHTRRIRQFGHWTENGVFTRGWRTIQGDFQFTPPLPDPATLPARLAKDVETIDLIPYGATQLRVTIFPRA